MCSWRARTGDGDGGTKGDKKKIMFYPACAALHYRVYRNTPSIFKVQFIVSLYSAHVRRGTYVCMT